MLLVPSDTCPIFVLPEKAAQEALSSAVRASFGAPTGKLPFRREEPKWI